MKKLDLVLENIRDEYMINLLEEGEVTELETLKTKKFLNESIQKIRGILINEGVLPAVQDNLKNNWKKYLAGAGTAAAVGNPYSQQVIRDAAGQYAQAYQDGTLGQMVGNAADAAKTWAGVGVDKAGEALADAGNYVKDAAGNLVKVVTGDEAQG